MDPTEILVSLVIPVYNKAEQLERAVESALAQTHENIEVIAVDDGSTDESPTLLRALAERDRRLVVLTQPNGGLSVARNSGLAAAGGRYVLFHDADDVLERDAVEVLLRVALETGSDVVGGVFLRHTPRNVRPMMAFRHEDRCMDFRHDRALAEKYCTNFSSCNKLFDLGFLRINDLRFTPGLFMQDIEFWIKVMFISRSVTQTTHVVSNYFHYACSSSQSRTCARFDSLFTLYDRIEGFFIRNGLEDWAGLGRLAVMQGACMFFVRWKLDDWARDKQSADLDRLRLLLERIEDRDFVRLMQLRQGPNAALLLLVRAGDYAEASRLRQSPYAGPVAWRRMVGRLDSADKILAFARHVGRSRLQKGLYEIRVLTPYYLGRPRLLVTLPGKAVRYLVARILRYLAR